MNWNDHLLRYNPNDKSRNETTGLVFDVQRFAIHDGGGIRTLVFLKGCPLGCIWCQNPESMSYKPQVVYIPGNCIDCGKCLSVCPENAIIASAEHKRAIDRNRCTLCGKCIEHCYAGAIHIIGRHLTVSELMEIILRDRDFYANSGGGVTFSGGEPTAQPAFLEAACREAKSHGLHTALETCGHVKWSLFELILRHIDLVLMDIKHMDSEEHRRLTGIGNELILGNVQRIASMGTPIRIRLPLIPGCNDSQDNIQATAAFVSSLPQAPPIDILPYHRLGEPKWGQLDRSYKLYGVAQPSADHVHRLADVIRGYAVEARIGG